MFIAECPSCEQRLIVGIPKNLPEFKRGICKHCGEEYLVDGWEFRDPIAQGLSVDSARIREPIYTHTQLAALLGIHPRTLSKWRKQGRIECYRLGLSVFYGESHIRLFLCLHVEQFDIVPPSRVDIESALSCMRSGHSPFSLQDSFKCDSRHWLTYKQMGFYFQKRRQDGTMDTLCLNDKIKFILYGPRRKWLWLYLR